MEQQLEAAEARSRALEKEVEGLLLRLEEREKEQRPQVSVEEYNQLVNKFNL